MRRWTGGGEDEPGGISEGEGEGREVEGEKAEGREERERKKG